MTDATNKAYVLAAAEYFASFIINCGYENEDAVFDEDVLKDAYFDFNLRHVTPANYIKKDGEPDLRRLFIDAMNAANEFMNTPHKFEITRKVVGKSAYNKDKTPVKISFVIYDDPPWCERL